ncbi:flagellar hook-associated protein FlgL [Naasia lichenicola]|uniref:Flagellar hook-associated protein 3 n=1 Tax=Naasia lichenicola TaxID=2565933 RepID=A0A4S4FH77_9MICO|nr:flagellar hook-associated protein FlgL [Naasia lichenicola]THG29660.1 flagellar hook-associated protein 3 [Naasia lichenicola]
MSIGRITSQQQLATAQRSIQTGRANLAKLQEQASTGRALLKPSDDPSGTGAALRVRAESRATQQHAVNITDGLGWSNTVDSALSGSEDLMRRAIDLTTQGANSATMTPASREAIATELEGIRNDLMSQANTQYMGRSVFAGDSDTGAAFTAATYAFSGTPGATVERRVSSTETVAVDGDGAAAFGTGSTSVFAVLDGIAADLRAGTDIGGKLTDIKAAFTNLTNQHGIVGARMSRLEQAQTLNLTTATNLETQRSGIEDIDPAKVIIDLKSQELTYQSALSVTAKVLQPTLLSFIS